MVFPFIFHFSAFVFKLLTGYENIAEYKHTQYSNTILYRNVWNLQIGIEKLVGKMSINLICYVKSAPCIIGIIINAPSVALAIDSIFCIPELCMTIQVPVINCRLHKFFQAKQAIITWCSVNGHSELYKHARFQINEILLYNKSKQTKNK